MLRIRVSSRTGSVALAARHQTAGLDLRTRTADREARNDLLFELRHYPDAGFSCGAPAAGRVEPEPFDGWAQARHGHYGANRFLRSGVAAARDGNRKTRRVSALLPQY